MATRDDICCIPHCATRRSARFKVQLCDSHMLEVFNEMRHAIGAAIDGLPLRGQPPRVEPRQGYVYFADFGDLVKIGYSVNPKMRVRSLGGKLIGYQPGTFKDERAFHFRFGAYWAHGEYFRNEGSLAEYVNLIREGDTPNPHPKVDIDPQT